jgi:hypothetical protein
MTKKQKEILAEICMLMVEWDLTIEDIKKWWYGHN